ncbi:MAG: hypothetical protein L0387_38850 [Acidobacteria bacterium]|nr:hypothetical protein [Acidobacteriota bacterium]MCI0720803.1 hypothetical protein [Acidobacteriota bacterium]
MLVVRFIHTVALFWTGMVLPVLAAGNLPDSREFYTLHDYGVEFIVVGVSQLKSPDETRVLAAEHGAYVNTNQEFIYVAHGRDFKDFTSKALNKEMILSTDTPKLPVGSGTRRVASDDQNLTVTVTHRGDYSSLAIVLDRRYNRTPRWIPSGWGGPANPGAYREYSSEQPFCGRTLDAVLKELTGNGAAYRPQYYVVTYEGLAEVVVPLKFRPISDGRVIKHSGFGDIYMMMFAVSPKESYMGLDDPNLETDATVGAFGMRVASPRELMYGFVLGSMLKDEGRKKPMYITLDTAQKLSLSNGVQSITADGQKVSVGVWHSKNSSRVVMRLPQTYQRTPHWWPANWGGLYNPGSYPEWATEKPFCERTLKAVLEKLVSGPVGSSRPSYTVSYASDVPELGSLDPSLDISLQGKTTCTLIVPPDSSPKRGAAK